MMSNNAACLWLAMFILGITAEIQDAPVNDPGESFASSGHEEVGCKEPAIQEEKDGSLSVFQRHKENSFSSRPWMEDMTKNEKTVLEAAEDGLQKMDSHGKDENEVPENKFENITDLHQQMVVATAPVSMMTHANKLAGSPSFSLAMGKSGNLLGRAVAHNEWNSKFAVELTMQVATMAIAVVGYAFGCPVCGMVVGVAFSFFQGIFMGQPKNQLGEMYQKIMEHVKIQIRESEMKTELKNIINQVQHFVQHLPSLSFPYESLSDKYEAMLNHYTRATAISIKIRESNHYGSEVWAKNVFPLAKYLQETELMLMAETEKLMANATNTNRDDIIRSQALELIVTGTKSYNALWQKMKVAAYQGLNNDVVNTLGWGMTTNYHEFTNTGRRRYYNLPQYTCKTRRTLSTNKYGAGQTPQDAAAKMGCNKDVITCSVGHLQDCQFNPNGVRVPPGSFGQRSKCWRACKADCERKASDDPHFCDRTEAHAFYLAHVKGGFDNLYKEHTDLVAQLQAPPPAPTPSPTTLPTPSPTSMQADCAAKLDGGGWTLVRHTSRHGTWGPFTDNLAGTYTLGTPAGPHAETDWSVTWTAQPTTEMLFAFGDCSMWLVTTMTAVNGGYYANADRQVLRSSVNSASHTRKWYNRQNAPEDPWISVNDHNFFNSIVYGEANTQYHSAGKNGHGGANVYIRQAPTPPGSPTTGQTEFGMYDFSQSPGGSWVRINSLSEMNKYKDRFIDFYNKNHGIPTISSWISNNCCFTFSNGIRIGISGWFMLPWQNVQRCSGPAYSGTFKFQRRGQPIHSLASNTQFDEVKNSCADGRNPGIYRKSR